MSTNITIFSCLLRFCLVFIGSGSSFLWMELKGSRLSLTIKFFAEKCAVILLCATDWIINILLLLAKVAYIFTLLWHKVSDILVKKICLSKFWHPLSLGFVQRLHSKPWTWTWKMKDLNKVLRFLKNNKSRDPFGLCNELFKDGEAGEDLKCAVLKLVNRIKH